jgi:hypothetical protein
VSAGHRNRSYAAAPVLTAGRGIALALALLVGAALCVPARAATYKWVDDKGVTHYTDKMPPEAVNKGSTVLDKQARPVKKIDPAATPEQIRAREAEEEQKRANARVNEETARRDRALMSSYTSEAEIDLARMRQLGTIDSQIESAQAYTASLNKRKALLDRRKAAEGDKPLPLELQREIESTETELAKQARLIEQKQAERNAVVARYDADKARWRELKSISDANAAAARGNAAVHPAAASGTGRK